MMMRPADKAGAWYPGDSVQCDTRIAEFLSQATASDVGGRPIGGIAPHAGWDFSGGIAAHTFAFLAPAEPEVAVLYGSAHYRASVAAIMSEGAWETPLGPVEIDSDLAAAIKSEAQDMVREDPQAHREEHSIELVMPFVKRCFPNARIVPVIVPPDDNAARLGATIGRTALRHRASAVFVGSSDLTHYGRNYGFSPAGSGEAALEWVRTENDRAILDLAVALRDEAVVQEARKSRSACGAGAMAATIASCKAAGATVGALLAYATSHDIMPMGPPTSFVGYGAVGYAI